jgi:hypothetical protein
MKKKKYINKLFSKAKKVVKVAKRKRYFVKAKKHFSRNKSNYGLVGGIVGAGIYGAFRSRIAQAMQPVTANIPLGNIGDEVLLGGLAVVLKKTVGKKFGMINPVLNGAIAIESARIGEAIATGNVGIGQSSGSSSSGYMLG